MTTMTVMMTMTTGGPDMACCVCEFLKEVQVGRTEAAHTGPAGMGSKSPDWRSIGLCFKHHQGVGTSVHSLGLFASLSSISSYRSRSFRFRLSVDSWRRQRESSGPDCDAARQGDGRQRRHGPKMDQQTTSCRPTSSPGRNGNRYIGSLVGILSGSSSPERRFRGEAYG